MGRGERGREGRGGEGRGRAKGEGREEERSGDSEQFQWNVIIFCIRNIARDLPQVYYSSS